ncbi:hypothetical protein KFK09_008691 [Dendrobium nobile]|uniref:Uncharacterized protein n=1 Tax=Dendrobium nobile TaxID=94219 RepID=A0A8T3BNF3_DENNO|nr:hypothetical protein KFK09_008691 [Dendrobium nobile]
MGDKMYQIPAFESWHNGEHVVQPGLTRASFFGEEDLFQVPMAMPVDSAYLKGGLCRRKVRNRSCSGAPKAVDEDLYKIPQELLYQKPRRKRLLKNLVSGCLGLSCIP